MDLGSKIRERREALGLTQEEAAAAANISPSAWRDIEVRGRTSLRTSTARGICRALSWYHDSIDSILNGGEPTLLVWWDKPAKADGPDLTRTALDLSDLPDKQRAYVLGVVDAFRHG